MRRKITIIVEDDGQPATNEGWPDRQPGLPSMPWVPVNPCGGEEPYDPCRNCPNRGKGACLCALPAMFGPNRITCSSTTAG